MKSITLGLALSLVGGVALAQTLPPSAPPPRPPAAGPAAPTPPSPPPSPAPQANPGPQAPGTAQGGPLTVPAPSGPPEGMVVETPNGFFLVRPGDPNPRRLDLGRAQPGAGRNAPPAMAEGEDAMGDDAMGGPQPPPPRPHGPPRQPPQGKGAHLRLHTASLDVDVKCPDDEPIKACVDAVSQLMDKAAPAAH